MAHFFANINKRKIGFLCFVEAGLLLISFGFSSNKNASEISDIFGDSTWGLLIFFALMIGLFVILGLSFLKVNEETCRVSGVAIVSLRLLFCILASIIYIEITKILAKYDVDGLFFYCLHSIGLVTLILGYIGIILSCCFKQNYIFLNIATTVFLIFSSLVTIAATISLPIYSLDSGFNVEFSYVLNELINMASSILQVFIFGSLVNSKDSNYSIANLL